MAMIWCDGFDEFTNGPTKYTGGTSGSCDLTGTRSRTGKGCWVSAGPNGPFFSFANKTTLIAGIAIAPSNPPGGSIFSFYVNGFGNVSSVIQVQVFITNTYGVGVRTSNIPFQNTLGTSVPNLFFAGVYAYVEMKATCNSVSGSVTVRVNGATVLTLTNVNTDPAGAGVFDTFGINGPGGGLSASFDDLYVFDTSGSTNNDLPSGVPRVYTVVPVSDNTPLQWTPSTDTTHFNLVNGVPAESQVSYVFDAGVGNIDNYLYDYSPVPPSVTILGVQHGMYAYLDAAGSGSLGSECGNTLQGSTALTTSPHIYCYQRDTDPVAAGPWTLANLINRQFGPNRTA